MKKLLVIAAVLATVIGARAADGTAAADSQGNPVFDVGGTTKLSGSSFVAALYWAPVGSSTFTAFTTQSGGAIPAFPFLTGGAAGFWDQGANGTVYAAGQAGVSVQVIARAWTAASGSFTAAQTAAGGKFGSSAPITIQLGGGGAPPAVPADLSSLGSFNLQNATVVPEPSTIALGLLGAGAMLLRRRK